MEEKGAMATPMASFTACCYCGNGLHFEQSHKFCTICRLRFCLSCKSSHPSAHTYSTYVMKTLPTTTDDYRPQACNTCTKLTHVYISCQRDDCKYQICTDCFDKSMDDRVMHEHDELFMTCLPHRESLDKFDVGCKACREGKAFAHCTRCLEGIQPSSYFYSCMDCLRIYDDVTSTANLCENCMSAVMVRPESLNHRFASFIFVISGEDSNWSLTCSQCHLVLPNLESNAVSRHGHNSWTITMGRAFAENYPQLAVKTCARTSPGSNSYLQYNYPATSPSPANHNHDGVNPTAAVAASPHPAGGTPTSGVASPAHLSRNGSVASSYHHHQASQSQSQTGVTTPAQVGSTSPDMNANTVTQSMHRMSLSHPQTPASPAIQQQQQQAASPSVQSQQHPAPPAQSPQMGYPLQQQQSPASSIGYPVQANTQTSQSPHLRQPSYPGSNHIYQPTPTPGQNMMQPQAPAQAQSQGQTQTQAQNQTQTPTQQPQATAFQGQQAQTEKQQQAAYQAQLHQQQVAAYQAQLQQQQQATIQHQHRQSMQIGAMPQATQAGQAQGRPIAMHASTAPAGMIQQMSMATAQQGQQVMYTNAQGQIISNPQLIQSAQPMQTQHPTQYVMTQQIVNGQLVSVQVPTTQHQQAGTYVQGQPAPGMLTHSNSFPTQVVQSPLALTQPAAPQGQVAMVPVRTANGATIYVPQSSIQVIGGIQQVKPGIIAANGQVAGVGRGRGRGQPGAAAQAHATQQANAQTNKFVQDLAKVAVGSLVKGMVSGAMSNN